MHFYKHVFQYFIYRFTGNPRITKEIIGVRKNSTFVSIGKKKSNGEKAANQIPNYLVISF